MPPQPENQPEMVHHLHALLHTLRVLGQQEDQFCTLLHAVESTGKLRAADRRELERLLEACPIDSLIHDLESVRGALPAPVQAAEQAHAH